MTSMLRFPRITGLAAMLLLSMPLVVGCGPSDGEGSTKGGGGSGTMTVPTVLSNTPLNEATDVPINGYVSAIFSEEMDRDALTAMTFTLTSGGAAVPGTVTYTDATAMFWPAAHLASNTMFTATITEGAISASGVALDAPHTWSFTTGITVAPGVPVNLGTAGDYVILAQTGISTVPTSAVTGNLGISPAAGSYITGFALNADATNVFSTSAQVIGKVYAANDAEPTPGNLTMAVGDMQSAFTSAAARAPDVTELNAGNIGGMTLAAGVYKWGTGLMIPTDVTLNGSATDVWIFQIAQDLTVGDAAKITLTGGALPQNVFWQVAGLVDMGTTSHFEGVILTKTSVTMKTGASLNGRMLAQTAVSMGGNTVVENTK